MTRQTRYRWGLWLAGWLLSSLAWADYGQGETARAFADAMVREHNLDRAWVLSVLSEAEKQPSVLEAISRPAEKVLEWHEYRDIFINDRRTRWGREFLSQHADTLARAEETYGVPPTIVAAILGVETYYGRYTGKYRVLDALATLAFDYPPRSRFFRGELEQFLLILQEQGLTPDDVKGSYAGAMGMGQFIPSSYRHYAVDFDDDGHIDLWNNPVDAIGSVANYFAVHGWQPGEPVAFPAERHPGADTTPINAGLKPRYTVGELAELGFTPLHPLPDDRAATLMRLEGKSGTEYWIGLRNFYVITRYNHSALYAMAVYQLSQTLDEKTR